MTLPTVLIDPGTGQQLRVNGEGELTVSLHTHPPKNETILAYPYGQYFTTDGTASGASSMLVNGSTTPVFFYVGSKEHQETFIKTISVRIGDVSSVLNKFGNITALTNGIDFVYRAEGLGEISIFSGIKTNLDFIRLGQNTPPIGDSSNAFRADVSGANTDTYLPLIDLTQTFGFTWGLRLRRGTNDYIGFRIKDDVSGLDILNALAFGSQLSADTEN